MTAADLAAGRAPLLGLDPVCRRLMAMALSLALSSAISAQQRQAGSGAPLAGGIVAGWKLHVSPTGEVLEEGSGKQIRVTGSVYAVDGPVGKALQFDGYTSALHAERLSAVNRPVNTTISCWLQLDAYPWNELPILEQRGAAGDQADAFFFGLDAEGHLLARFGSGTSAVNTRSEDAVPLRTWFLVTLAIDAARLPSFSIDGKPSPSLASAAAAVQNAGIRSTREAAEDLLIGHVRGPLLPGPAAMIHPQLPVEYSIEGALGGLAVYDQMLSSGEIKTLFEQADKHYLVADPWPKFPRGEGGQRAFGAFYTTLNFDRLWDRSRRIGPDSDVVVRFDDAPIRLVFWQGNNYVPAWVTENNRWYTDEFMEIYGHPRCPDGEDCEPMSDKQSRYSHVRILESTAARAVVHWRYALSEVEKYGIGDAADPRDWGDWADEYWTIYPDGIAVRKSVLWSTAAERDQTEFQESIVLIPPGETPEDNVNFDALTFADVAGASNTYRWQPKAGKGLALPRGPESFPEPKDAVIQWVNLKSEWKPFQVAWGNAVRFAAYNGENSISSFEWWNHWPVAQIPSSGRPALAPDRAGHTSLSHIYWPVYEQDEQRVTKILLDGLTQSSAGQLGPIAASWRNPAQLELRGESGSAIVPYDAAQRAYLLPAGAARTLRMTLHATSASPAFHPAFVIPGWQGPAKMTVVSGADAPSIARTGSVEDMRGSTLIVYLPITASHDVVLELRPE